jgi:hypothetical protein
MTQNKTTNGSGKPPTILPKKKMVLGVCFLELGIECRAYENKNSKLVSFVKCI